MARLDREHGSPYDRGSADSYYGRRRNPHYYKGDTARSELVTELTEEELVEYHQGFDDNEASGNFKDWG
jgi:hypothetical protein